MAAIDYARAALVRGPLVRERQPVLGRRVIDHYRFGRRRFSAHTVKLLVDRGEAVRDGDIVRAA